MRAHPAWASWCKLVEIYTLYVQHSFDASDVERLDDLQLEHSRLFDAVPEYAGLKRPKHHFMAHIGPDLWQSESQFGPPRGYWCFGFEGFNKVIKDGAKRSNWICESLSIMQYWSMRVARSVRGKNGSRVECSVPDEVGAGDERE